MLCFSEKNYKGLYSVDSICIVSGYLLLWQWDERPATPMEYEYLENSTMTVVLANICFLY